MKNAIITRTLLALGLVASAGVAQAVQVEFNVPVELKHIDPAATHVTVTCGNWSRQNAHYLNYKSVEVPLQNAGSHKTYSGVVRVVVTWPGTTVPTGDYRCAMSMRTAAGPADFTTRPAAPRTTAVIAVDGTFGDLNLQAAPVAGTRSTATIAPLKPLPPKVPSGTTLPPLR
jgi:hypothetical protein